MDLFYKKGINSAADDESGLVRCLTGGDLIFLGIGAVIGAGIFILTGIVAALYAGPAIVLCFIVAGLACAFSALCYAELASCIGGCGGAYGYAYAGFGEIFAWIVGWDLLLEYSISTSAVAVGWSGYLINILSAIKIKMPSQLLKGPLDGGILNIFALAIIVFLIGLLIKGAKSGTRFNNVMVSIKLVVILIFIAIASTEIQPKNWIPFMPYGWNGVMKGASLIFFAYIGFDALSTAAEEAIKPQRDLPRGILGSLLICTILYIAVAAMLTGIVPYSVLNVPSPISYSLLILGHKAIASLIGVGAIAGLTTVMFVLFYGLTRVFLAMSRDGLLPLFFAKIDGSHNTPVRIIVVGGTIIALFSALVPLDDLAELVNIGTLFAFMMVCAGVLYLRYSQPQLERPFRAPWVPFVPIMGIITCAYLIINLPAITLIRFLIWMTLGLVVYFLYGCKQSILLRKK